MRLGLLPLTKRPTLHESRPAPFREADVDDIEVPRDDCLRKYLPRLAHDLGPEIEVLEVREGEHLHTGEAGELGGADGRRVQRLVRALLLFRSEGGLVDEDVGIARRLQDVPGGPRVAGQD